MFLRGSVIAKFKAFMRLLLLFSEHLFYYPNLLTHKHHYVQIILRCVFRLWRLLLQAPIYLFQILSSKLLLGKNCIKLYSILVKTYVMRPIIRGMFFNFAFWFQANCAQMIWLSQRATRRTISKVASSKYFPLMASFFGH